MGGRGEFSTVKGRHKLSPKITQLITDFKEDPDGYPKFSAANPAIPHFPDDDPIWDMVHDYTIKHGGDIKPESWWEDQYTAYAILGGFIIAVLAL